MAGWYIPTSFSFAQPDRYLEVRYEDLLETPEKEAARLFRFLGVRIDEEMVDNCLQEASFEKRADGRERGREDSTSAVREGIAGDWKNIFTEKDRQVYEEVAGDLLVKLGYENGDGW